MLVEVLSIIYLLVKLPTAVASMHFLAALSLQVRLPKSQTIHVCFTVVIKPLNILGVFTMVVWINAKSYGALFAFGM